MANSIYVTVAKLKTHLGITGTDQDTYLQNMINRATAVIDIELWAPLHERTLTYRVDWMWGRRIVLKHNPKAIQLVEVRQHDNTRKEIEYDFVDWFVVYLIDKVDRGTKNVRVTYDVWYADGEIPLDFEQFFLRYVSEMIQTNLPNSEDKEIKTKKLDGLSITYFSPNELWDKNKDFATDYWLIKQKYSTFSYGIV